MTEETGKLIDRRRLGNGVDLVLYDRSRNMAGDRWLVELLCRASFSIPESFWEAESGEDGEHLPAIRKMLGERLVFDSSRKCNFVSADARERILREMVQEFYDATLQYLDRPDFARKLFKRRYRDARQKLLLQEAMNTARGSRSVP